MKYLDGIRAASNALSPQSLGPLRRKALEQFVERGFPTPRLEDWKYTDLKEAEAITAAALAALGEEPGFEPIPPGTIDADWLLIANGRPQTAADSIDGVDIVLLSEAGGEFDYELPLADLNLALLSDGLHITVPAGTRVERPIGLLFEDRGDSGALVTQGRVIIDVMDGASAAFIELHRSAGAADIYANNHVELNLGAGAKARYARLQERDRRHVHTASLRVTAGRDAALRHFALDTGGRLVRNDLRIALPQPGADVSFNGIYIADREQHIDNHTRVDHIVGPARSQQEYRGILRGRAVWNGKAVVHEGADGTDAEQANHNLLLSSGADINAKPELEIYAEDVKCSHGTTVGQLDDTATFYLRSRGLDTEQARRLMTQAFVTALATTNPIDACGDHVAAGIDAALAAMQDGAD